MTIKDAPSKEMIFALFLQFISQMQNEINSFKFHIGSLKEPDAFDVTISFKLGNLSFQDSVRFDFETTATEEIKELKAIIFEIQEKITKIRKIS